MQPIFDAPVSTPMVNQQRRVGPIARKTGDGVLDFDRRVTLATGRAFEAVNLRQAGPNEMPGQPRAGLQVPLNGAAMSFRRRAGLRQRRSWRFGCDPSVR